MQHRWWIFGACAAAVVLAMAWITAMVLQLDRGEGHARADAEHQSTLRLALWRMDSWLAPQLAREAARSHFEYQPFHAQQNAYTKVLSVIEPGEVLTPSPLLAYRSEIFPLHFQLSPLDGLTSPQVPTGNWRDFTEGSLWKSSDLEQPERRLAELRSRLEVTELHTRIGAAYAPFPDLGTCAITDLLRQPQTPQQTAAAPVSPSHAKSQREFVTRSQTANMSQTQQAVPTNANPFANTDQAQLGPLVPLWLDGSSEQSPRLIYARKVRVGERLDIQGFLVDWPRLRDRLLAQAAEILPEGASLTPEERPSEDQQGSMLATLPALLRTSPAPIPPRTWRTTHTVLLAAWLAVLAAALAAGVTLRSVLQLGDRRARFASAVTHELRTPLTTFRMYSEMLETGMVSEPERRAEYLATLRHEADRLSRLVENVLGYARLEEGRYRGRRERLDVGELLTRVSPVLEQRAEAAGMELVVETHTNGQQVETDPDAVEQILFNLVDNACKYAAGAATRAVEIDATNAGGKVRLAVRDHGPGVPTAHRGMVFEPFERGDREAGDNETPGIGLGLPLSRSLARSLGGALRLEATDAPGARFVLELPATAPA